MSRELPSTVSRLENIQVATRQQPILSIVTIMMNKCLVIHLPSTVPQSLVQGNFEI